MTTEQQVCKQHVIAHTTQQDDRGSVERLPTKMDTKQLLLSSLSAKRRMHIFERRLEQELKIQYHYFMRKSEELDHRDPVKFQRGRSMLLSTNCSVVKKISSTTTLRLLRDPTILNIQVKHNTTQLQPTNSTDSTKRKVLPMNFTQSTKCFNPLKRWQNYRTSWPLKVANGNSFHHMDLTSEDYVKQQ